MGDEALLTGPFTDGTETRPARRDMGPYLFLSLFLLLLAFFILLNALATIETRKAQAVMRSVAETFQSKIEPQYRNEVIVPTLGTNPEPEQVTEELERIWLTAFPLAQVDQVQPGRTLQISLPLSDMFAPQSAALSIDRGALMTATSDILARRPEGFVTQMQALLGVPRLAGPAAAGELSTPAPEDPLNFSEGAFAPEDVLRRLQQVADNAPTPVRPGDLAFERAMTIAQAVLGAGAPPDAVSTGLKEGDAEELKLRFFVRPIEESVVTFAPATQAQP